MKASISIRYRGIPKDIPEEKIKEDMKDQLFELCELWVFKGKEPNIKFEEE